MPLKPESLAPALVAVGVASMVAAPIAAAEPVWPVAGAESAADTVRDLEDQGYTVAINWVRGYSTEPLSRCSVSAIYNPRPFARRSAVEGHHRLRRRSVPP